MTEHSEEQRTAEIWALAGDENLRDLLVWRVVKARAEAGGFNGLLISDYRKADEALAVLTSSPTKGTQDAGS